MHHIVHHMGIASCIASCITGKDCPIVTSTRVREPLDFYLSFYQWGVAFRQKGAPSSFGASFEEWARMRPPEPTAPTTAPTAAMRPSEPAAPTAHLLNLQHLPPEPTAPTAPARAPLCISRLQPYASPVHLLCISYASPPHLLRISRRACCPTSSRR